MPQIILTYPQLEKIASLLSIVTFRDADKHGVVETGWRETEGALWYP